MMAASVGGRRRRAIPVGAPLGIMARPLAKLGEIAMT